MIKNRVSVISFVSGLIISVMYILAIVYADTLGIRNQTFVHCLFILGLFYFFFISGRASGFGYTRRLADSLYNGQIVQIMAICQKKYTNDYSEFYLIITVKSEEIVCVRLSDKQIPKNLELRVGFWYKMKDGILEPLMVKK